MKNKEKIFAVAPMMDWTDRHCRVFHRQFTARTLLYTEMVTAAAIVHGDAARLLEYDAFEHPVALQLGGSEPAQLAQAVAIAAPFGYDVINLNVGCPSDRVQSGRFGAVLMEDAGLVAECVAAMIGAAGGVPVSVKCRIGVDDQEPAQILPDFLERVSAAGISQFTIHARKAWLKGLSPKENRDVPPLDYDLVLAMKAAFPQLQIGVNGGISTLDQALEFLEAGLDEVMIGRAAYHEPANVLASADRRFFGTTGPDVSAEEAVRAMLPYIETELARGTRLHKITRHMLGAFTGQPGARHWRRSLSEGAVLPGAGPELLETALAHVTRLAA